MFAETCQMKRTRQGALSVAACLIWLCLGGVGVASTKGVPGPATRDAVPGILVRLGDLSDNQGMTLGKARVEGEFNEVARRFGLQKTGPRSRNYSLKMVWAPERERSLYVGANHGQPHRLNDVWEFDLAAMTWIMLYAPDCPRSYKGLGEDFRDVNFRDGLLITKRGGPAVIGHTWSGITYDPVNRRLLYMNTWVTNQDDAIRQLGGDPGERYKGPPLWSFDPKAREWAPIKTDPPGPAAPYGAMLEYVADLRGAIWHMNNWQMRATWLFDTSEHRWARVAANEVTRGFKTEAPSRELVGYYDPGRKMVVAHQGTSTFHFDIAAKQWTRVISTPKGSQRVPIGHDARAAFYHDAASGHGLLVNLMEREIWAYDPDAIEWSRLEPTGDPMPSGERMLAYVDHARKVLVVIDDVIVWVYRYRN